MDFSVPKFFFYKMNDIIKMTIAKCRIAVKIEVTGEEFEPLCFQGMDEQKVMQTQLLAYQVWQTYRKTNNANITPSIKYSHSKSKGMRFILMKENQDMLGKVEQVSWVSGGKGNGLSRRKGESSQEMKVGEHRVPWRPLFQMASLE